MTGCAGGMQLFWLAVQTLVVACIAAVKCAAQPLTCCTGSLHNVLLQVMDGTEPDTSTSLAATNPRWLSPEVLHGGRATFASVRAGELRQRREHSLGSA